MMKRICAILLGLLLAASLLMPMFSQNECAALVALTEQGKPYVLGAYGPVRYDCSGLVMRAYREFGVELHHSAMEVGYDEEIETISSLLLLRPGDLIFFDTIADGDACDHVGFYIGLGRFVHASSSGGAVMISRLDAHWREKFSWGKRLASPWMVNIFDESAQ